MGEYKALEFGELGTVDYEIKILEDGRQISPFHDIPLFVCKENNILNMVVEIPRWTTKKLEITTEKRMNPIKQDIKNGKMRTIPNCFPYHGYIWNYGALPQTWESPHMIDEDTQLRGDGDPLDAIEFGSRVIKSGTVKEVKVVGALALVDEGELDWKIFCIDITDPQAVLFTTMEDVKKHAPGLIVETVKWFKIYKVPDGKYKNTFAFDDEPVGPEKAMEVITKCHEMWRELVNGGESKISIENSTLNETPGFDRENALISEKRAIQMERTGPTKENELSVFID